MLACWLFTQRIYIDESNEAHKEYFSFIISKLEYFEKKGFFLQFASKITDFTIDWKEEYEDYAPLTELFECVMTADDEAKLVILASQTIDIVNAANESPSANANPPE
jgi:hypothetical protein